ncbi:bifunctional DNA primase/polymerase [Nocardia salmonicida]|uniref:bifunctional DNA primase/polymerase n=1 Tax=Nocardia salmonicida TaxID=53431 RepID=UPI0033D0C07C
MSARRKAPTATGRGTVGATEKAHPLKTTFTLDNSTREVPAAYIKSGWSPFPIPAGQKYPPPDGTTGHVPDMNPDTALELFDGVADANIGVRVAGDVIGIDVDQYGDKRGADTLAALVDRFGPLPDTYRSTRRGADNPSGIRFYRVPTGRQWKGKAGADIDIIQRTHRYAVVWPSVFEGRTYRWFGPDGAVLHGVPLADELPLLPAAWVAHLTRGAATPDRTAPRELDTDPRGWLANNVPGYTDAMSSELARVTAADRLAAAMSGNGHDGLLSATKHVVRLAVEGHAGLGAALDGIETAFRGEVTGRRSASDIDGEVFRAVAGEVAQVREELAAGELHITTYASYRAEDAHQDTSTVLAWLRAVLDGGLVAVDAAEYEDNDLGRAELFMAAYDGRVIGLSDSDEFRVWTAGRWATYNEHQVGKVLWRKGVGGPLREAADRLDGEADELDAAGDAEAAKDVRRRAVDYRRRAVAAGNRTQIRNGLALARVDPDYARPSSAFDRSALLGTGGGVLDPERYAVSGDVADLVRPARRTDFVSRSIGFEFEPDAHGPYVDKFLALFLPDEVLRADVFRVLGAAALTVGNPIGKLVVLRGEPSTGKSTALSLLAAALGEYAGTVSSAVFRAPTHDNASPELANALDWRLVTLSESSRRDHLHADVVKRLTGGLDQISVRRLYSNDVLTKVPAFAPIMATNAMPTIQDADAAVRKRLLTLPFDVQHLDGPLQGVELTDADRSHFLRELVDGFADWKRRGLEDLHPSIGAATAEAFADTSPFQKWSAEHLVTAGDLAAGSRVAGSLAWDHFALWQDTARLRPADRLDRGQFLTAMRDAYGAAVDGKLKRADGTRKSVKVYPLARWRVEPAQ